MSAYLSAQELADMIGCEPNSYACMRRYLQRNGWPFEPNLRGFPKVSRAYHDARMAGQTAEQAAPVAGEPDFSMFSL
ncbi:MAG TPA: DUF4224 domain-containing protein [Noviherbaspirillum sp.]|nr:DUF4224 domain-containing protein [Noviherbaspirillum sp.]